MSLQDTPRSNRLHIGIFGKRNSGKSSLINALTNQQIAVVSDMAGTTTDPVYKSMEIHGIGPCVFIDTAGFDDIGDIGKLRVSQTKKAMEKTDIALMLFSEEPEQLELEWVETLKHNHIPVLGVIKCKIPVTPVSTLTKEGIDKIRAELIRALPSDYENESITGQLASSGDTVLLVMPQDIQAPKGRLILPQVQILRELLDKKCIV